MLSQVIRGHSEVVITGKHSFGDLSTSWLELRVVSTGSDAVLQHLSLRMLPVLRTLAAGPVSDHLVNCLLQCGASFGSAPVHAGKACQPQQNT